MQNNKISLYNVYLDKYYIRGLIFNSIILIFIKVILYLFFTKIKLTQDNFYFIVSFIILNSNFYISFIFIPNIIYKYPYVNFLKLYIYNFICCFYYFFLLFFLSLYLFDLPLPISNSALYFLINYYILISFYFIFIVFLKYKYNFNIKKYTFFYILSVIFNLFFIFNNSILTNIFSADLLFLFEGLNGIFSFYFLFFIGFKFIILLLLVIVNNFILNKKKKTIRRRKNG